MVSNFIFLVEHGFILGCFHANIYSLWQEADGNVMANDVRGTD